MPLQNLSQDKIGGAVVMRGFSLGGKQIVVGSSLTVEQFQRIPRSNFNALVENRFIQIYPGGSNERRFIIVNGDGSFSVISGTLVNSGPLTIEQAREMALVDKTRGGRPPNPLRILPPEHQPDASAVEQMENVRTRKKARQ